MSGYPPPGGYYPSPGQPTAPPYGYQPAPTGYPGSYPIGPAPPPGQPQGWAGGAAAPSLYPGVPPEYHHPGNPYPGNPYPGNPYPGVQPPAYPAAQPAYPAAQPAWPGGAVPPDSTPGYHLQKSHIVPQGAVCLGRQNDTTGKLYSAVAHTKWGTIPGKAKGGQCWFPYGDKELVTKDFSWVVSPGATLRRQPGGPPPGAMAVGNQTDGQGVMYAGVARTQWGMIPGKAKDNTCWYSYAGKEHYTSDFEWVIAASNASAPVFVCPSQPPAGQTMPRRYFFIRSEMHGKIIDVSGGNRAPGTMVIMWQRKGGHEANQLWYTDEQGIIKSKLNDFAFQPSGHGIWLQPFRGSPNQRWIIQGRKIVNQQQPNLCLDITGESQEDGAKICQYQYKGSPNQHWCFDYI